MLGIEEARLQVEPGVELDAGLQPPARQSAQPEAIGELLLELRLHGRPVELRIVVAADDVKTISLVEKTGERVEDLGMALERLAQLPGALGFLGVEAELALFRPHLELRLRAGRDGDRDEVDDVAIQDEAPRLAVLAPPGMPVEEFGQLEVEPAPEGPCAGLQVHAQVQIGDGEQVVGPLLRRPPDPLPHPAQPHETLARMLPQLKLSKGRADCSAPREQPEQRFPLHAVSLPRDPLQPREQLVTSPWSVGRNDGRR